MKASVDGKHVGIFHMIFAPYKVIIPLYSGGDLNKSNTRNIFDGCT
jgi:hypothetical protein